MNQTCSYWPMAAVPRPLLASRMAIRSMVPWRRSWKKSSALGSVIRVNILSFMFCIWNGNSSLGDFAKVADFVNSGFKFKFTRKEYFCHPTGHSTSIPAPMKLLNAAILPFFAVCFPWKQALNWSVIRLRLKSISAVFISTNPSATKKTRVSFLYCKFRWKWKTNDFHHGGRIFTVL